MRRSNSSDASATVDPAEPLRSVLETESADRAAAKAVPARKPGARNRSLDVLRGWAIALMISSHIGAGSRVSMLVNAHVWIDAAGPFVILAGLVLGMIVAGGKPETAVWSRARQLWIIHVALMVAVTAVHELTGRLRAPSIAEAGGPLAVAWKIPTLRIQALDYMNILPLFIAFFCAAPLLLGGMRRGYTSVLLMASVVVWAVTQRFPEWLRFTEPASGPEAFALPAWQLPFVLGLSIGFHGQALAKDFWPRHRSWLVPVVTTTIGVIFGLAQLQRKPFRRFGGTMPASWTWFFGKETWGPGRAVYTLGALLVGYVFLEWIRGNRRNPSRYTDYLELMGARSLYCFLVHLPLALLASALALGTRATWMQDAAALAAFVAVYQLAKHRVLGRYIPS